MEEEEEEAPHTPQNQPIVRRVPDAPTRNELPPTEEEEEDAKFRLPFTNVGVLFGLAKDASYADIDDARRGLSVAWNQLSYGAQTISTAIKDALAGVTCDPMMRILPPRCVIKRRQVQEGLVSFFDTCVPVFEALRCIFSDDIHLLAMNALWCYKTISGAVDTARNRNFHELHEIGDTFLKCFYLSDAPTMFDVSRVTCCMEYIRHLPCVLGLRVSEEHWRCCTMKFAAPVSNMHCVISYGTTCSICKEKLEDGDRGMALSRRCGNRLFAQRPTVDKCCEGHECTCTTHVHKTCLGRHFYEEGIGDNWGGYAKCPTCNAEFCMADMTTITFGHAEEESKASKRKKTGSGWIRTRKMKRMDDK